MRKIVIISAILMALMIQMQSFAKEKACEKQTVKENFAVELAGIGFHKKNDIDPTIQIKNIFSGMDVTWLTENRITSVIEGLRRTLSRIWDTITIWLGNYRSLEK